MVKSLRKVSQKRITLKMKASKFLALLLACLMIPGPALADTCAKSLTGPFVAGQAVKICALLGAVSTDLVPLADDTYDLGSASAEWQDLFLDGTATVDGLSNSGTSTLTGAVSAGSTVTADGNLIRRSASGTGSTGTALNSKVNCVTDATDSGAATQVLTGVIPAGVVSKAVTCYVNTVIVGSGAASFSLGDGTDADLYGTGIAFAAGTTVTHADYTASPATQAWSSSAGDLTLTANAGQFDSGNITCCSFYDDTTGASS